MNTVCTHCQAINRIPDDRIEDAAKCADAAVTTCLTER